MPPRKLRHTPSRRRPTPSRAKQPYTDPLAHVIVRQLLPTGPGGTCRRNPGEPSSSRCSPTNANTCPVGSAPTSSCGPSMLSVAGEPTSGVHVPSVERAYTPASVVARTCPKSSRSRRTDTASTGFGGLGGKSRPQRFERGSQRKLVNTGCEVFDGFTPLASVSTLRPSATRPRISRSWFASDPLTGNPRSTSVQVASCSEMRAICAPVGLLIHSVSPVTTMPLIVLFVNGDGVPRSGTEPAIVLPSQSARPRVVPIHTVSPCARSTSAESEGSPSKRLMSDQRPPVSSRLTPLPGTAANRLPLRSNAIAWMSFPASPFGSGGIEGHESGDGRQGRRRAGPRRARGEPAGARGGGGGVGNAGVREGRPRPRGAGGGGAHEEERQGG